MSLTYIHYRLPKLLAESEGRRFGAKVCAPQLPRPRRCCPAQRVTCLCPVLCEMFTEAFFSKRTRKKRPDRQRLQAATQTACDAINSEMMKRNRPCRIFSLWEEAGLCGVGALLSSKHLSNGDKCTHFGAHDSHTCFLVKLSACDDS